ncbi:3972_t:CDS:2 [Cetraspora pellucida]|uniref:3972_t:CDS:1 n=1 Tax=Cetraspora pellucida TaxID=1433469 RepID=A0ACA9K4W5_9GLOM|nr:3972_t:CDS:2 [Cetraspora pellucida]
MGNSKSIQSNQNVTAGLPKSIKLKNKSCIFGYATAIEEIITRCINEKYNDEKHCQDPLEMNSVPCFKPEDLQNSCFSITKLARQLCRVGYGSLSCFRSQQPSTDFDAICDFYQYALFLKKFNTQLMKRETLDLNTENAYGIKYVAVHKFDDKSVDRKAVERANSILISELRQIKYELESLATTINDSALKHMNFALNIWCTKSKMTRNDWSLVINGMNTFISTKPINDIRYFEAYITAISLYTFAVLFQNHDKTKISNVINRSCELLSPFICTSIHHNAEGSFIHNVENKLPGMRLIDIFGGLHQGLKIATIQKFECEEDNIISSSRISKFIPGLEKLNILPPTTISKNEKWNNVTIKVDVRFPLVFTAKSNGNTMRIRDVRSETWEFKPNEHNIYISKLLFKTILEISSIFSVIESLDSSGEESDSSDSSGSFLSQETLFTINTEHLKLKKSYCRKLYCNFSTSHKTFPTTHITDDLIVDNHTPWTVYSSA